MATVLSTANTSTYDWTSGDLTLSTTGAISVNGWGLSIGADNVGSLINNGAINATWAVMNGGTVTSIVNNGTIVGTWCLINGIQDGQPATITSLVNNGTIGGPDYGIINSVGSTIGTFINTGTLSNPVENYGTIGTLNNSGIMSQGLQMLGSAASMTNLINSGTISGNLSIPAGGTIANITNSGTIALGLDISKSTLTSTVITNSGTIEGKVTLSPNGDILNIQGGSIQGDIVASYAGHGTVNIEVGAGNTYVAQGNIGDAPETVGGFAVGTVNLDSGTLSIGFSALNATALDFVGSGTALALTGASGTLNATVAGFGGGDTIDLIRTSATSAALNVADQLVIKNNDTVVATLQLTGSYAGALFNVVGDGAGGSEIEIAYNAANATQNAATLSAPVAIVDSALNVMAVLDKEQSLAAAGHLASITFTDGGTPTLSLTLSQMVNDAKALALITDPYKMVVSGDAADIQANLDALQTAQSQGKLAHLTLTDTDFPILSISTAQAVSDAAVLNGLDGTFSVSQTAAGGNLTINGISSALGNSVAFTGSASQYSVTAEGDGSIAVSSAGGTDMLNDIQALHFSDVTDILAHTPGSGGIVTSGNIAELYGAVFGRVPDVAGLAFYENVLQASPALSLTTFAEWFLASPEYTGNSAHDYAPTTAGDTQFITDLYQNLLKRAPEAGAVPFYLNVIEQMTQGLVAGTDAYASAEKLAHAVVLSYVSASPEFLTDVTVTAQSPSSAQHWLVLA